MLSRGTDDLEVIVVGAGAAGIGAAIRLAAARISFAIFEARGRVGGRAYTIDFARGSDRGIAWHAPLKPADDSQRTAQPEMVKALHTALDARRQRIVISQSTVGTVKWASILWP
jgi:monoamine oxidase